MQGYMFSNGESVAVPHLKSTEAATVWHYTTGAGLIGIVSHDRMWASSTLALNDKAEIEHGLSIFNRVLESFDSATFDANQRSALGQALELTDGVSELSNCFVVSASKNPDSLNQWQGYAGSEGFALGLDTKFDLSPAHAPNVVGEPVQSFTSFGWLDVLYNEEEQLAVAGDLLNFIATYLKTSDELPDPRQPISNLITLMVPRFKHAAFEAEQEVRCYAFQSPGESELFRPGARGGIVPYMELAASTPGTTLPIVEVRCGPSEPSDAVRFERIVRRLLWKDHPAAAVSSSQVPFRL